MDVGVHVSLWTPEWTSPFLDGIDKAADLGCSCVEIPLMDPANFPLDDTRRRLAANGLSVYCGTGLSKETDIGSSTESIRENGIRHLSECLRLCAELGSDSLGGVIHSPWGLKGRADPGYSRRVASSLARLADLAAKNGTSLALECINRYENSFLNTVDQCLALLGIIGRENVGLHLDTYHMNIEESGMVAAMTRAGARLLRLHLSENTRGYPGSGALAWDEIIAAAKASGYKGPWILESYVQPDFPASSDVCVWRPIEPDSSESLRRSIDFIRELVSAD
ncbi:MAG: epimerase [Spirochaetae bacterium HGW-Spirochaetae-7]|jgi:D-psicose/D-tagatose/L-ribulose 3-epimerase|nr:MAG: epimerase [Spirochaetae bacterium HGW-Spirochaetae-7]